MTQQIINTGNADKGNGDPIRTAFTKVNANFTELYSALGTDSNIPIQTGNGGKYLTTNGTTLSWATVDTGGASVTTSATAPVGPDEGDLWWDPASGRLYVSYNANWVDASPVDGVGETIDLSAVGQSILPSTNTTYDLGSSTRRWRDIYLSGNTIDLGGTLINSDGNGGLSIPGGMTVPNLFPRTFTATVDDAHYAGTLTLTGSAWFFEITFDPDSNGTIETLINNTPWTSNPGYTNGMAFTFTEADHGIPGYTFTLTLTDIQNPGPMMHTTNLAASQPPEYPATIKSDGAIKLTADTESLVFGTDGSLTLPPTGTLLAGTINFNGTLQIGNQSQTQYQFESIVDEGGPNPVYYSKLSLPNIAEIFAGEELSLATWGSGLNIKTRNPDPFTDYTWSFRYDGTLIAPSTIAFGDGNRTNINQVNDNFVITTNTGPGTPYSWTFDEFGNLTLPGGAVVDTYGDGASNSTYLWSAPGEVIAVRSMIAENDFGGGIDIKPDGNVDIIAQNTSSASWTFNENGNLTFPDTTVQTTAFTGTGNIEFRNDSINDINGITIANAGQTTASTASIVIPANGSDATLSINNDGKIWLFGTDGLLTFPGSAGFEATFGNVAPRGDVLHSVNNLYLESEQSVDLSSGDEAFELGLIYDARLEQLRIEFVLAEWTGAGYPAGPTSYQALTIAKASNPLIPDEWIAIALEVKTNYDDWQAALTASGVNISVAGSNVWNFGSDGKLQLPTGLNISPITSDEGVVTGTKLVQISNKALVTESSGDPGSTQLSWRNSNNDVNSISLNLSQTKNVVITTGNDGDETVNPTHNWRFLNTGGLMFPDLSVQNTAWTGSVAYANVTGTPTIPSIGTITFSTNTLRNTTSLGGTVNIQTASQQGDPAKTWSFDHSGAGSLILTDGSTIRAKHGFNILATEPDFVNFTGLNDFDTLSFHDQTNIVIINPEDSILAAIDPASPDCTAIIGATVRIMLNNGVVHNSQLTSTFVGEENNPFYGLPVWTATIPNSGIASTSIKEISIGNSANWRFGTDGMLTVPGIIRKDDGLYMVSTGTANDNSATVFVNGNAGSVILRTDNGTTNKSLTFDVDGNLTFPDNTVQTTAYPGITNTHNNTATLVVGQNVATRGNLSVRLTNNSNTLDVEINYENPDNTVSVSAYRMYPASVNVYTGRTSKAPGNTTWDNFGNLPSGGDSLGFTFTDHSFLKVYRVTVIADVMPGVGAAGEAFCTIEELK